MRRLQQGSVDRCNINPVETAGVETLAIARQHLGFFTFRWVTHADFEKEAIELRFGQREGPLEFDGILSREDSKRFREGIARPIDGDLALFHGFQEGCLRAGRCAIDFVDEQKICEYGAAVQRECTVRHVEYVRAHHVGRHQISGALHTLEAEPANSRHRFHGECLCDSWNAFDQRMAAANEHDEKLVGDLTLADDHFGKFAANVCCQA